MEKNGNNVFSLAMNNRWRAILSGIALATVILGTGALVATSSAQSQPETHSGHHWLLKADMPIVIGGYGDNFDYTGKTVRPVRGFATLDIDPERKTGTIEATLHVPASSPLHFSRQATSENGVTVVKEEYLEGEIKVVLKIDQSTRLVENEWLHGDTGKEAPVLPDLFNWIAGWPKADVYVNGQLAYKDMAGHFMFAEQLRRPDGSVRHADGTLYTMDAKDKSHYTIPGRWELHVMVMSMDQPDEHNFPPFAKVLHANFENIFIANTPPGVAINYSR